MQVKHQAKQCSAGRLDIHEHSRKAYQQWRQFPRQTHFYKLDPAQLLDSLNTSIMTAMTASTMRFPESQFLIISNFTSYQTFSYLRTQGLAPELIPLRLVKANKAEIKHCADVELFKLFQLNITRQNAYAAFQIFQRLPDDMRTTILTPDQAKLDGSDLKRAFMKHFDIKRKDIKPDYSLPFEAYSEIYSSVKRSLK